MSEGSLPPFRRVVPRLSPLSLLRQTLGRLSGRLRTGRRPETEDPEVRSRVASAIRAHAESHATLFERAARLRARTERLERQGTPSDSAANRAGRAEDEVRASLADLRSSFAGSDEELAAFERELGRHYPVFRLSGE